MLPWQPNKMAIGHKTHILDKNHPVIRTAKYVYITSLVMEKMQFNHFSIMSMGAFCCHGNQTKRQITIILAILNCPYPSNICTKSESYCFSGFGDVIQKIPF